MGLPSSSAAVTGVSGGDFTNGSTSGVPASAQAPFFHRGVGEKGNSPIGWGKGTGGAQGKDGIPLSAWPGNGDSEQNLHRSVPQSNQGKSNSKGSRKGKGGDPPAGGDPSFDGDGAHSSDSRGPTGKGKGAKGKGYRNRKGKGKG